MKVFVTGMFRSGTTYLARALNSIDGVRFASDPFMFGFKGFRGDALGNLEAALQSPIPDYYFNEAGLREFEIVQERRLAETKLTNMSLLRPLLRKAAAAYAPSLSEVADSSQATTYGQLLDDFVTTIEGQDKDAHLVGFKDVWCTEFIPHFLDHLIDSKAVVLVRDVRAVYASNRAGGRNYDILTVARQWRKQVALAITWRLRWPKRVLILTYEDLVGLRPETVKDLSVWIDVDSESLSHALHRPQNDDGGDWLRNSSFPAESWPGSQAPRELTESQMLALGLIAGELLNFMCWPEIEVLGGYSGWSSAYRGTTGEALFQDHIQRELARTRHRSRLADGMSLSLRAEFLRAEHLLTNDWTDTTKLDFLTYEFVKLARSTIRQT